jgi:hypothetical protein
MSNVKYVGSHKILHLELPGLTFEIPPAHVVNNEWVLTNPNDYVIEDVREAIKKAHKTVWTKKMVDAYKKEKESEIISSYNEKTLTDEQFAEILKIVPELSGHYFHPNEIFINKMKELFSGHHIIDCGAGNGYTGKILTEAGFDVTCIDIASYENYEYPVKIMNALDFKFTKSMVCLICRPDKEDWAIETMKKALKSKCPVVYIRKKNVSILKAELLAENVGRDNEYMYAVQL